MQDLVDSQERPIRVMQLIAGCQVGGLEVVTLNLVDRLRHEFDFAVVCYDKFGPLKPRYERMGVDVNLVPRRPGVDLRYPFELAKVMRRLGVDVLHAHNNTALFYGVLAALLCGGTRVVFTAHDRALPKLPNRVLQRMLGKATTRAVAVSEEGKRRLLSMDGFNPARVEVVHNGADEQPFQQPADRRQARESMEIDLDAEVLGTVARVHPEKNIPMLVRAFARLAKTREKAVLVIAGDGPERERCERLAAEIGVASKVRFLGTRDDVARVLAALDVFVLSSDTEGLPLAVIEAMGAERPVVATDVGAVRELVREGETGWLVQPGDEEGLAARVADVLDDPERAKGMGALAGDVFRSGFTLGRMAAAYGRVYREAVEGVE